MKKYGCPCACEVLLFAGLPSGDVAAAGKVNDPVKTPTRTLLVACTFLYTPNYLWGATLCPSVCFSLLPIILWMPIIIRTTE